MGRGGEPRLEEDQRTPLITTVDSQKGLAVANGKSSSSALLQGKPSPLADMPVEELRKKAALYGVKAASDSREDLLVALHPYAKGMGHVWQAPKPLPLAPPPFGLKAVRDAIPAHCFERSLLHSLLYLAADLIEIAVLFYAATYISSASLPAWAPFLLWPAYWFVQGTVFTGVWVLAHECGHQSFSPWKAVNDFFGLICHSLLLVPYHSWRITHGKHHSNTGSCEHDEVFCPPTRGDYDIAKEMMMEAPAVQLFYIVLMLVVGWMPGYLFLNCTGPKKYHGQPSSHFNPWAAMFEERDFLDIVVSDIGFIAALGLMGYAMYTFGFVNVLMYYIVPYMVCNAYLVLITFLQHTDVFMPHFRGKEWNWFRGALCTADRSFGPVIDHMIHHISDTHVCHHIFSKMPFYKAQVATPILKEFLGEYYLNDPTPIRKALWRSYTCCKFVETDEDIVFYKSTAAR